MIIIQTRFVFHVLSLYRRLYSSLHNVLLPALTACLPTYTVQRLCSPVLI